MYAVAGVSGRTGAVVASALLEAGRRVRVIVRNEARGTAWRARGAEVGVASLEDGAALARALAGTDGAYLISPQDMGSADPLADGWRIADAIARALHASPIEHLVLLSSIAAQHAEGTGLSRTLHAAEARLAEAPPRITFLRAAFFLENWAPALGAAAGGKLPTFVHPDRALPMVATRDVGAAAARALLEGPPAARREVLELVGPCDLRPRDLSEALARLLGRPVALEHVPLQAVVPFLTAAGVSQGFAEQVQFLYQAAEEGLLGGQAGVRRLRGAVTLEAFLREALAATSGS